MSIGKVSKLSLVVFLSKTKLNKDGLAPILFRITLDGKRVEINLQRKVEPSLWDSSKCRVKGRDVKSRQINDFIETIFARARNCYNELITQNKRITPELIRDQLLGKSEIEERLLIQVWEEHISDMEKLLGIDFREKTIGAYTTSKNHMIEFFKKKRSKKNVAISDIDNDFIEKFENYLKIDLRLKINTVVGIMKRFRCVMANCHQKGWVEKNPFEFVKLTFVDSDRPYLVEEEVQKIIDFDIEPFPEKYEITRDLFLFSCFTGLAFVDVEKLKMSEIEMNNGVLWIKTRRQKTGDRSHVPLLDVPKLILEKYAPDMDSYSNNFIFPQISNCSINLYLKNLMKVCKIKKNISFHAARHTFATTVTLTHGVPLESVSRMLGHRSIKTTQHYAKIVDKKVEGDMLLLSEKLSKSLSFTH